MNDDAHRGGDHLRRAAIVLFKPDRNERRNRLLQFVEAARACTAEAIDGLIGIPDHEQAAAAGQSGRAPLLYKLSLNGIDVLKFIHEQMEKAGVDRKGVEQQVIEIARIALGQRRLIGRHEHGRYAGRLAADAALDAGDGALYVPYIAILYELTEQRARFVLAEQRLWIEQTETDGVEGADGEQPRRFGSKQCGKPLPHLGCCLIGERYRRNGGGGCAAADQMLNALDQRMGFSRSRPGDDLNGGVRRGDGLLLRGIGAGSSLLRLRRERGRLHRSPHGQRGAHLLLPPSANAKERELARERSALRFGKQLDRAVLTVETAGAQHLSPPETADTLGHAGPGHPLDVLRRQFPKDRKFRPQLAEQPEILLLHGLACRGYAGGGGDDFGERHEAFKGLCMGRPVVLRPVGERPRAVLHADGQPLAANGAAPAELFGLLRVQPHAAVAVPVEVIFSLLRKELQRTAKALAGFNGALERTIAERPVDAVGLAAEL